MSVSTHPAKTSRQKGLRLLTLTVAASAVIALAAWAIASSVTGSATKSRQAGTVTHSGLATPRLNPKYVEEIGTLSLAQLSAAFGTGRALMSSSPLSSMTPTELQRNDAVLASLTPKERQYVRAIESTSYAHLAAAFEASK
jgi:hypothetical protein